jgi:phospholipase/carboxylesterase
MQPRATEEPFLQIPETVELQTADDVQGSVIWLHGLGADGHDFEPIVPELRLPAELGLRFVFPHAPLRPVTINGGMTMRAWYDVLSLDRDGPQDEQGIRDSAALLGALMEREHERGIAYERMVCAGFSQGGAIALHTALRCERTLAGLMVLSSWLPLAHSLQAEVFENEGSQTRDLPVFAAHGTFDPMLPVALGHAIRDTLGQAGFAVEWHEYPMAHAVCADEIQAIRDWLISVFG